MSRTRRLAAHAAFPCALALLACGRGTPAPAGDGASVPAAGAATTADQPPGAAHPNGAHLWVESVATEREKTTLVLRVVNGRDGEVSLGRRNDPMLLLDGDGATHSGPEQPVKVAAGTAARVTVEFLGRARGERGTLRLNSRYGNDDGDPQLTVSDIPLGDQRFAAGPVRGLSLAGVTAAHPSGVSVALRDLRPDSVGLAVGFEAVNGATRAVQLAGSRSHRAFVQDARGARYYLVPPSANPALSIPAGEKLAGTLRFAGRLPAGVGGLTLHFNDQYGGTDEYSASPKLTLSMTR